MALAYGEIVVDEDEKGYDAAVDESDTELFEELAGGFAYVERAVGEALDYDG